MTLGYRFCLQKIGLSGWPLRVESKLGGRRATDRHDARHLIQTFTSAYVPTADGEMEIFAHLEFALRHEGTDLAALAALFTQIEPTRLAAWIRSRPSGKYARRLGFLYEWLTNREIPLEGISISGPYETILDEEVYFTGPAATVSRWHVRNNLPGGANWCPTIHRRTLRDEPVGALDVAQALRAARDSVPEEIFERALSYAYLAETQASYAIEHEAPTPTQRHAFLRALQTAGEMPVSARLMPEHLSELQGLIFTPPPSRSIPSPSEQWPRIWPTCRTASKGASRLSSSITSAFPPYIAIRS